MPAKSLQRARSSAGERPLHTRAQALPVSPGFPGFAGFSPLKVRRTGVRFPGLSRFVPGGQIGSRAMKRHRSGGWFIFRRWFGRHPKENDTRPYFEVTHYFQARDMAQAEFLWEAMTDALGCKDTCGPDTPCPHFRFGALRQLDDEESA